MVSIKKRFTTLSVSALLVISYLVFTCITIHGECKDVLDIELFCKSVRGREVTLNELLEKIESSFSDMNTKQLNKIESSIAAMNTKQLNKIEASIADMKQQLNDSELEEHDLAEEKMQIKNHMDCEGFPSWPLIEEALLYDDTVGAPKCHDSRNSPHPWVLHQSSAPDRRPSRAEVEVVLANLPPGTGYKWHSDADICAFMRTQPLRFQALYNALPRTPHKVDLWRYLFLYKNGGIYLDDDAVILTPFNASFVDSIDSVYMTQGNSQKAMGTDDDTEKKPFGLTIYNGFLISRPCNHVLLSVAERMVHIGPVGNRVKMTWEKYGAHPSLINWYNLKLLAMAIAERAPNDLGTDAKCSTGVGKCLLFQNTSSQNTPKFTNGRPVVLYKDDHNWTTAVFDSPFSKPPVAQVGDDNRNGAGGDDPYPNTPWKG
jgi:hypothetical protein